MSTIMNKLANHFSDFYEGKQFDYKKAQYMFGNFEDNEKRVESVKSVYEILIYSPAINASSKIYIMTNKSYAEVAKTINRQREKEVGDAKKQSSKTEHLKTEALVKADIAYTNKKLKPVFEVNQDGEKINLIDYILYRELSEEHWDKINDALIRLETICRNSLIPKGMFWLNIPVKEYNTELEDLEFENLLKFITPYFQAQKMLAQMKLNSMKREAGYLNYLFRGRTLSERDQQRIKEIRDLADISKIQYYKEKRGESDREREIKKELIQLRIQLDRKKEEKVKYIYSMGVLCYKNQGQFLLEDQQNRYIIIRENIKRATKEQKRCEDRIEELERQLDKLEEQKGESL